MGVKKKLITRKRKEDLQDSHDWISSLPDELLLHILSFMPTKDVKKTSLLSRRWKNLWKFAYCLDFSPDPWDIDMVAVIDKSIAQHMGTKLWKFRVSYDYKHIDAPRVDFWINFAVTCNVEEMDLDFFYHGAYRFEEHNDLKYTLPHSLFECGWSIKVLRVCGSGFIDLPNSMSLRSLKKLTLDHLDMSSDSFRHLTTCCPLEDLILVGCNKNSNLHISDVSGNLKTLRIDEFGIYEDDGCWTRVIIDAPSLHSIEFMSCFSRVDYCIKEPSTHTIARLLPDQMVLRYSTGINNYEVCGYNLARALNSLHVKHIKLCNWFIQVLSIYKRTQDVDIPIQATFVQFHAGFTKWEIPGIAYILKNSPTLEILTINICRVLHIEVDQRFKKKYNFDEERFWDVEEIDCVLPRIRTVAIHGFPNGCSNAKGRKGLDYNNAIRFVRFLLKNLNALQRLTIFTKATTNKKSGSRTSAPNNSKLLHDLTGGDDDEFCKASLDAVLCIA